ncbi:MAG: hypothetical protein HY035_03310 [Nitrospirae bacterium]|nr:hypothetical protein [Nitrospirota bacterium]MBI3377419.1 hypothetical protein [Nitrospirota bacterium]
MTIVIVFKQYLFGICLGIVTSILLAILMVNSFPYYISEYLPIFVGAYVTNLLINKKPLLIGGIFSVIMILVSILNLVIVVSATTKSIHIPELNFKIILSLLIYIPVGLIGGYFAHLTRKIIKRLKRGQATFEE